MLKFNVKIFITKLLTAWRGEFVYREGLDKVDERSEIDDPRNNEVYALLGGALGAKGRDILKKHRGDMHTTDINAMAAFKRGEHIALMRCANAGKPKELARLMADNLYYTETELAKIRLEHLLWAKKANNEYFNDDLLSELIERHSRPYESLDDLYNLIMLSDTIILSIDAQLRVAKLAKFIEGENGWMTIVPFYDPRPALYRWEGEEE